MIEILPAHKIQNFSFKNRMCKVLNTTAIASGYAGRDPQGGTSDGSLFSKFSLFLFIIIFKMIFTMKKKKCEKDWEFGDLH